MKRILYYLGLYRCPNCKNDYDAGKYARCPYCGE